MKRYFISLFILSLITVGTACTNDKPHPETNTKVIPMVLEHSKDNASIEVSSTQVQRSLDVKHQIKGNDIYVECVVTNFTFTKGKDKNVDGEGHIELYLNGEKVDEIATAAFIIKELPPGNHTVKLELVHNDSLKYNISKEFDVSIEK
ncbi:hypothetical protein IM538_10225 [Cytobacillus suaedae]|nr:hypothetical protein IM538_10225 [Cytobacillus suaedae]